ncbi:voltage-dependent calcium channel subunit alpha-2/delta-4-like [Oncorhynchus keta]|uniref:voltage-dependent calcium channel subunit alpha-2/delta-4-like n=1 Tax=Oncorhynchus keta TaxID=8018 RepID=UPI00227B8E83|nr:voltage-dependent calcium channel subunit alpha-2/delta-4-like [Oncorhynchus keta]
MSQSVSHVVSCLTTPTHVSFTIIIILIITCQSFSPPHSSHPAKPGFKASAQKKKGDILQPCDTEYPSFVYEPSIKETNSLIKCGRCQKMFVTQAVPDSNLLMLVVQADCDCSRQYPAITMEPKEVKYIL